jgi:transposase InsO family protein
VFEQDQFLHWCRKLNLTERAVCVVQQIRSSGPARLVQSGRGNVSGRYPSRKMGVTIQFESHKNELARIQELEHACDVIEFFDQPPSIKLEYQSAAGKKLGVLHTPDFFVIRETSAGWEECKLEEELDRLAEKSPNRYCRDETGRWRCPPGESYAAQFGLDYRVVSSARINWVWQRNIIFLDDYLRADLPMVSESACTAVRLLLSNNPGLTLEEMFGKTEEIATRDDWYQMIACGDVYVDLHAVSLSDHRQARVFPDRETAVTYSQLVQTSPTSPYPHPTPVNLVAGNSLNWDGKNWTIVNVGEAMIGLINIDRFFTELPVTAFERLLEERRITGVADTSVPAVHPKARELFAVASRSDYATANYRSELVRSYLKGELSPNEFSIPARTFYRWVRRYREAQETLGSGYLGLLPRPNIGNRKDKLPAATRSLLVEFIQKDYETIKQKKVFEVYAAFTRACEEKGVVTASYKTFCQAVKRRPSGEQALKRQGPRAAYQKQPFYWELEQTTPRHGERPFQIVHIDHTELDAELVCSLTGCKLGRPWATFLSDAFSRRILAVYLTFDPPSYRSCMMVIRECVRRFGRMPQIVVVDGGIEFSGVYFETLLARYECTKKTRPPAAARFGSVCERLFGVANTQFVHNLQGNTQITRQVRQVTKSVNPQNHAIWTLERLYQYLCLWAYEIYDTLAHPALSQSPRDAYAAGMAHSGHRLHRLIPYDADFRIFTFPTTSKGTALVVPGLGVKINNIYYWNDSFRAPDAERTRVEVRFDPCDAATAWAFVSHRWVECFSEHYAVFHQRSERELMIASQELRRRKGLHSKQFNVTAAKLAQFLESVEAEEALLKQRLADREARAVWKVINGGQLSSPDEASQTESKPHLFQSEPVNAVEAHSRIVSLETYQRF